MREEREGVFEEHDNQLYEYLVHVQEVLLGARGTRHSEGAAKRPKNLFKSSVSAAFGEIFRLWQSGIACFALLKMTSHYRTLSV